LFLLYTENLVIFTQKIWDWYILLILTFLFTILIVYYRIIHIVEKLYP